MDSKYNTALDKIPEDLKGKIGEWLKVDENPETINEVLSLCEEGNWTGLHKRFDQRIVFGTAGLRACMEAGFSRINTLVVLQATQGLSKYIKTQFPNNLVAVVGHDHRFHSKEFAEVTATVFLAAGFKVYYLNPSDSFVHTPLVPFAVNEVNASVGVMITASHNPKMDNGYKVYYANGCQIIPPHDKNIAACIDENLQPWKDSWNSKKMIPKALNDGNLEYTRNEIFQKYVDKMNKTLVHIKEFSTTNNPRSPWLVYTPMHGVGYDIFHKIASECLNLEEELDYLCVPEQIIPDPSFPTVSFPNPEERGALDIAIALAQKNNISLVLANDPDADRFSVAVKNKQTDVWQQLTGNEIGFLLAYHSLEQYNKLDPQLKKYNPLAMLNSTVSSQMIKKMAEVEGFHYEDTLTGFKWIGNKAVDLEKRGYMVLFGFEEAIGYMFPAMEHDKDGISAAVVFLQASYEWEKLEQMSPLDILEQGFKKYGVFKEYNGYYKLSDLSMTDQIFAYFRNEYTKESEHYPSHIGKELQILTFRDLTVGYQSDTENHVPNLPVDPSSQMITMTAKPLVDSASGDDSIRFTIRGSGTEPKLKVYIEAYAQSKTEANSLAHMTWDVLKREWFRPEETGLTTNF